MAQLNSSFSHSACCPGEAGSPDLTLRYGQYCGEIKRRCEVPGFFLTETTYVPRVELPVHKHEQAYICVVLRGSYTEILGGLKRECGAMTVAFHPASEPHSERFHTVEVRSFNVEPGPEWLKKARQYTDVLDEGFAFQGGELARLGVKLYEEFRQNDRFSPLAIEGLLLELTAAAARQRKPVAESKVPPWLEQARELLHSAFADVPTLEKIAATVGIHPVHLAREFRRYYQCTIGEYIRKVRVEHACLQLTQTDMTLMDLALESGFYDQSHFCRSFKRITGMTPAHYREQFGTAQFLSS